MTYLEIKPEDETMKWGLLACMVATMLIAGCGGGDTEESGEPTDNVATAPAPSAPAPPPPPPPPAPGETPSAETPSPSPSEPVDRKPAVTGVGKKGKGYGTGPIATPVAAYFSTRQRVVFDIQIASAMNLYHATNQRFPKTHEEFMKEIIEKNMIKLPELAPGESYRYDPEKAAKQSQYDPNDPPLWVEKTR